MFKRMKIIILLLLALGMAFILMNLADDDNDKQPEDSSPDNENEESGESETSLDIIFDLAKQGEIPDSPIVVGETTADDVQETWGEPEETNDTDAGLFLTYPSHDIDIGIADDIVTDIRSSKETVTSFDLETIKSFQKPDDTRYYEDEEDDQIILVYDLSDDYVLKWVFPNPADDADNPEVDHISLSKEMSREGSTADMSLDEKIGQMIFGGVDGTGMNADTRNIIKKYHVGGIILFSSNIESADQTVSFLNDMKTANADNPYPLLLGVDEEGGSVTRIPDQMKSLPTSRSIGELNDPEVAFNAGAILGEQMQALGFNLDFAPVLDVTRNPNNPVIGDRSFGDNSDIVTRLGIQTMKGIQSEGVISVIKHFPGHGDTGVDSHLELPKVEKSYDELRELELVPFKKAISEGADVSMIAHILLPQIDQSYPASMSNEVITGMLREDYNFDGVVITDDLTMGAITDHYTVADAAVETAKAGGDLLLVAHDPDLVITVFDELKAAVENGEISEDRIDESVERITNLKTKYQLSDEKTPAPNFRPINERVEEILQKVS
ncbi:beta-N-acetylhexosaminidase [Halobacillus sp. A5]|uniref:beta-N-acetylhexosaminidase n=1 Tax=Halobacillus sp. A5 TaxID=2880263 RepID=UPI0020A675C7|nr:beta-N-acetylhexosaminidase [Halobacillus sp. A5]MCP3028683.1 beta-N-acetylhexosaminidase [Halobacillus sp. A5]